MKKITALLIIILIGAIISYNRPAEKTMILEFEYSKGSIRLVNKTIITGFASKNPKDISLEYHYKIIEGDKEKQGSFNPDTLFIDGIENNELTGGIIILNKTRFFINTKYSEEIKKIEIYHKDKKIYEIDILEKGATPCRVK